MPIITYKFVAHPTAIQQRELKHQFEICRKLQKFFTDLCFERIRSGGSVPTHFMLCDMLPELKKETPELKEVNSQVLQNLARRVALTMRGVITREISQAEIKKQLPAKSLTFPQFGKGCRLKDDSLYMDKVGLIPFTKHREILGKVKTAGIILGRTGRWHVFFAVEVDEVPVTKTSRAVGIDFGIRNFITLSDGVMYPFPKGLRDLRKEIAREVRMLRGVKNPTSKQRRVLDKKREKYKNQMSNYLNKLVGEITRKYDAFYVENIQKQGLGRGILKAIVSAMPWRRFMGLLKTKCKTKGLIYELVSPVNTSRTCCRCGNIKDNLTLKDRTYNCIKCGASLDRDVNAAIVILQNGIGNAKKTDG